MKTCARRSAFTLIEVLIVVVIMAILAATIIPQFTDSTKDAKASTATFNLHTLRSQIELYRAQHAGLAPATVATLVELTQSTNESGIAGTGAGFPYGPYIREIPANPFTNSKVIKSTNSAAPAVGEVTVGGGGWIYNPATGGIWIDYDGPDHLYLK
jgi:general secretion pathway protein G